MNTGNPLLKLRTLGQSVWLDYIDRALFQDGTLERLIADDGLAGMTSNPAIFEKAIADTDHYTTAIAALVRQGMTTEKIYEALAIDDVRHAADLLRPVYEASDGRDGYVSLEVSPLLADDTGATVKDARRLWDRLARANVMIKVPATRAGIPAVSQLIREGINVNVTLLFSVGRYVEAAHAYVEGLARRLDDGKPVDRVASVASFFLSRIDTKVDALLDQLSAPGDGPTPARLRGEAATASAALAYRQFMQLYATPRWADLAGHGARAQRLLWASTSTKDPSYSDIKYVEADVYPDTVNTLPMESLAAYRDHGRPELRDASVAAEHALATMKHLADLGINVAQVDNELEREGIRKFVEPYEKLLATIDTVRGRTGTGIA